MRLAGAALFALLVAAGCGASVCETYADMEWQCGNYPADEKELTLLISQESCHAGASSPIPDERRAMAIYAREGECAKKHRGDCAAYEACKDALREPTRRAAR